MDLLVYFFVLRKLYADLSQCGDRHSGGGRGFTDAPRSVKVIDSSFMI